MAKVLVIGGGGREHAVVSSLVKSPQVHAVTATPGNAGTNCIQNASNLSLNVKDHQVNPLQKTD